MEALRHPTPAQQASESLPSISFATAEFWTHVDTERLTFEATQRDDSMVGNFRMFPENGIPLLSGRRGMILPIGGEPGPQQGRAVGFLVGDKKDWRNPPNADGVEEGRIHSACSYSMIGENTANRIAVVVEGAANLTEEHIAKWRTRLAESGNWFAKIAENESYTDEKMVTAYKISHVLDAISPLGLLSGSEPSQDCDCRAQGRIALEETIENGGWFMENCDQEGRGHGLAIKAAIYELQRKGLNSALACLALGIPWDVRDYSHNARVLRQWSDDPKIRRDFRAVRLKSQNPGKADALRKGGITVVETDHIVGVTSDNLEYLLMKAAQGYRLQPDELRRLVKMGEQADDNLAN